MDVRKIVAEIDAEIASLQQARAALVDLDEGNEISKPRRGRPKGSTNAKTASDKAPKGTTAKVKGSKRHLSPEGRKRIAEAMKRRWAQRREGTPKAAKKAAAKKEAAKETK